MSIPLIRLLTPADADAYAALRHQMITTEPFAFLGVPGDDPAGQASSVERFLADPEQAIIGAFISGQLVSCAGIYREKRVKRRHRAAIWGVYTAPEARRQGLCRLIMRHAIDHSRRWPGVEAIGLSAASTSVAAIALYESLGFARWGVEPDATRTNGTSTAEVHMLLILR